MSNRLIVNILIAAVLVTGALAVALLSGCSGPLPVMPERMIGGQHPAEFWRDQNAKLPGGI